MNNKQKTSRIKGFLLLAAFLLISLSTFTYYRVNSLISASDAVTDNHEVKYKIEKLYSSLKECETNVRGFIISRDSAFLPAISNAKQVIDTTLKELSLLIDEQQKQNFNVLAELVNARKQRFNNALNDTITAKQVIVSKRLMDQIDQRIKQMQQYEDAKLLHKTDLLNHNALLTPIIILALIFFAQILIGYEYFHLTKQLKQSHHLQSKILDQNKVLSERKDFIEAIINSSDDIIVVVDKNEKLININHAAEKLLIAGGIQNGLGKSIRELEPDFENSELPYAIQKCFQGEKVKLEEYTSHINQEVFEIDLIPLKENDTVYAFVGIAHNINKSVNDKRTLQALNESLEYQNDIYKHAESMMMYGTYRADFKTRTLEYSDNLFRMLGCEPGEFVPSAEIFLKFVHPDDISYLLEARNNAYEGDNIKRWEYRMIRKNGELYYIKATSKIFTDQNGEKWLTGTLQNITEEKIKEFQLLEINEKLKISEYRYQLMIGEVEEYAILFLSKNGVIENWNKGIKRIHGYEEEEIVGKEFSIFYTKNDKDKNIPMSLLEEAALQGKSKHEGWRLRKNGTIFWGYVVLSAIYDNGELIGYSKIVRDLTERKIADENALKHAKILEQKNRDLEKINKELQSFAYISSHDLQEPLRKIQTFSDKILMTEFESFSETGKDYFKKIQSAALRMQQLIEDLLEYAQTNTNEKKFTLTHLKELVNDVQSEMKETFENSGARVTVLNDCEFKVIVFQFRQLLQNLFSNAIKFAKKDQPCFIEIDCHVIKSNELGFADDTKGDYAHITIKDNGIGFEKEYSEMIFELFKRLHGRSEYKGTGIGLAICKKIVENHQGFIKAEGFPGESATFHIYIPLN